MKILALIVLILGILKIYTIFCLSPDILDELSYVCGIEPKILYKNISTFLAIDGILSVTISIFIIKLL